MLSMRVIEKSKSEWAPNCVVVFKKDRTARVCTDYCLLNEVTRKDSYPLCDIQTSFDCLHGSAYYTSLDLHSGYYQIEVDERDQNKTVFIVPGDGLYIFKRMPLGYVTRQHF